VEALDRARKVLARWDEELRRELPDGADVFDAHVHLGEDVDGMVGRYDDLIDLMDRYEMSRCFMFCLDEPDRHPAFRAANDRTLAFAARSGGRIIPFVRLDLNEEPIEEATRCLDLGARGIKLHPRAQKFTATDDRLRPVFELAAERRVPILIHGGRGLPPISAGLRRLMDDNPGAQLIIAHAGIADMASLAECFAGRAGVFFDTSVWSPVDLLEFYRLVPPEQVVYASDFPYGQQPSSLLIALRTARLSGFDDTQVRDMLAGNATRIADGAEPKQPSKPLGSDVFSQPMVFARIHQYLSMATPLLWTRQADTVGVLGLALNATDDRNGRPEELGRIRELIATAQKLWADSQQIEDEAERWQTNRITFRLVHLADILAVTTQ
jgi:predicted TIM-barrel fold metal-dependent hydrolase